MEPSTQTSSLTKKKLLLMILACCWITPNPERERTLLPIMTYKQEISEEITPAEYDLASALEAHVSFSNVMQVSKRNFEEHEAYYEKGTPGRGSIICEINSETKPRLDAQLLARKWGIGLDAAKRTIRATTSRGIRSVWIQRSLVDTRRTTDN